MNSLSNSYSIGIAAFSGMVCSWLLSYYKNKKDPKNRILNEYIFFTPSGTFCTCNKSTTKLCANEFCSIYNARKVMITLQSARHSIDLALYLFTLDSIFDIIITAYKKGVKIRLITCGSMANDGANSKVAQLQEAGVPVRLKDSTTQLMHTKYAIVDGTILINGSFNWTHSAFDNNYECGFITSDPVVVQKYERFFHAVWTEYSKNY